MYNASYERSAISSSVQVERKESWLYFRFDVRNFFVFKVSKDCSTVRFLKYEGCNSRSTFSAKGFLFKGHFRRGRRLSCLSSK